MNWLQRLFDFHGIAGRGELIATNIGITAVLLISVFPIFLTQPRGEPPQGIAIVFLLCFGILAIPGVIISLAVIVRRFHDLGHSGWYVLLIFIPIINNFVGLYLLLMPGRAEYPSGH
jgi:uncharacterized membrane protein YhaH (DUF805 family)